MTTKIIPFPTDPIEGAEWTPTAPEKIISGHPQSAYKILYTGKTEEFAAGIYECTPGKWKIRYTEDEFCTLVEGIVRLTNDKGEMQEFRAPASFLIPAGFSGTWEAIGKIRKFFVLYEEQE